MSGKKDTLIFPVRLKEENDTSKKKEGEVTKMEVDFAGSSDNNTDDHEGEGDDDDDKNDLNKYLPSDDELVDDQILLSKLRKGNTRKILKFINLPIGLLFSKIVESLKKY